MTRVAILMGGPDDLPGGRVRSLGTECDVIYCEYRSGVEEFRFSGERIPFDSSVLIYEWIQRG